jgi:hypothetical protein
MAYANLCNTCSLRAALVHGYVKRGDLALWFFEGVVRDALRRSLRGMEALTDGVVFNQSAEKRTVRVL